ncbi:hypothetical protein C0995_003831 [Termitomyces sp. Mi166|nr:hypothetical protein C0995_003831 [Termitomyces sp. Mi166\
MQNFKAYQCYEQKTEKIYKTYHVKFCKSHEGHPHSPIPVLHDITTKEYNDPELAEVELISINNDDLAPAEEAVHENLKQPQAEMPPIPQLHRFSHVSVPTIRADPDNAPQSWVQKAVQELIEAGKHTTSQEQQQGRLHTMKNVIKEEALPPTNPEEHHYISKTRQAPINLLQ